MKKCYDVGYMLIDALERGIWWMIGLAAFLIIVTGNITL